MCARFARRAAPTTMGCSCATGSACARSTRSASTSSSAMRMAIGPASTAPTGCSGALSASSTSGRGGWSNAHTGAESAASGFTSRVRPEERHRRRATAQSKPQPLRGGSLRHTFAPSIPATPVAALTSSPNASSAPRHTAKAVALPQYTCWTTGNTLHASSIFKGQLCHQYQSDSWRSS